MFECIKGKFTSRNFKASVELEFTFNCGRYPSFKWVSTLLSSLLWFFICFFCFSSFTKYKILKKSFQLLFKVHSTFRPQTCPHQYITTPSQYLLLCPCSKHHSFAKWITKLVLYILIHPVGHSIISTFIYLLHLLMLFTLHFYMPVLKTRS